LLNWHSMPLDLLIRIWTTLQNRHTLVGNTIGGNRMANKHDEQMKALGEVAAAGATVEAAKRTSSQAAVARAEQRLRAAVDRARELGVEWGRIGATLGIARGCAYQRYRRHARERPAAAA
jgi:hypothetical protein